MNVATLDWCGYFNISLLSWLNCYGDFLAGFLVRRKAEVKQRLRGLPNTAILMGLLIKEPDYGAAVVMLGGHRYAVFSW